MTDTRWRIGKAFDKYSARAKNPVPAERLPFFIGSRLFGSVAPEDADLIAAAAPAFITDGRSLHLSEAADTKELRSEALRLAAEHLRGAGRLKFWRNELLDVRETPDSEPAAVLERGAFRLFGLLTCAVHLNAESADGRIWTAQRSDSKAVNPSRWDNLAAGMAAAGEKPETAMAREAQEEAGLLPGSCRLIPETSFISSHATESGWLREVTLVYRTVLPEGFAPENQDGEVQQFSLLTADEMAELTARGKLTQEASLAVLHWLAEKTGKVLPEGFYSTF